MGERQRATRPWHAKAACAADDVPAEWFFADGARARRVCADCRVRSTCLDDALEREAGSGPRLRWGIWGGRDGAERARIARCRAGQCRHLDITTCDLGRNE